MNDKVYVVYYQQYDDDGKLDYAGIDSVCLNKNDATVIKEKKEAEGQWGCDWYIAETPFHDGVFHTKFKNDIRNGGIK